MTIYTDTGDNTSAKRLARVRDLCEGLTVAGMSDADVTSKLDKSDRWMEVKTNKFDWVDTDERWGMVLDASEHRCASEIMHGVPDKETKAQNLLSAARETIKGINFMDHEIQKNDMTHIKEGPDLDDHLDPDNFATEL